MANYRIISSDNHVMEPTDLCSSRVDPKIVDRAPRIVRMEDGSDWWVCDSNKIYRRFRRDAGGREV